TRNPDCLKIN
ncbi:jg18167, partial [Pararge aegeria aegeria]